MKSKAFIHNNDANWFHMAIQGTKKMVVMGCINFEDQTLIKRRRAIEKWMWRVGSSSTKKKGIAIENCLGFLSKVMNFFKVLEII
jgi:hypothetical protein